MSTHITFIQHYTSSASQCNNEIKSLQIEKEEVNTVFACKIIIYEVNSKEPVKNNNSNNKTTRTKR